MQSPADKRKRVPRILAAGLLWHQQASAGFASEEETLQLVYGTERMVSIATGSEQLLYKAPAIATVLTRQDIEHSAASNLNELLEMVPGLHVSDDYYAGDAIYTMRGFFRDPDAGILFMVNGATLNTLEQGSRFSALRIPLENIEQIEIIRGPGSAVYGADAFVGVINIVTRQYQSGQEYGIRYGSFSSQGAWLQNNFMLGSWSNHLSLQYQSAEGDRSRIVDGDLQSFLDDVTATSASRAPGALQTGFNTLDLEFNASQAHWNINQWLWMNRDQGSGHGVPGLDTLDPAGKLDSQAGLTTLAYDNKRFATNWALNLRLSYLYYTANRHQNLLPAGSLAPVGDDGNLFTSGIRSVDFPAGMKQSIDSREQHAQAEASSFYYGWTDHSVRLSAGYQLQKYAAEEARNFGPGVLDGGQATAPAEALAVTGTANESLPDGERRLHYVSLQDEWNFVPDWSLTAGMRYDSYSDFGNAVNPRLALVWQTRYNLSTKLLYGRAFRAPVYKELKLQNQLGYNGNADLQPETIDTLELSLDYRPGDRLRQTLSVFAHRAKNLIFAVEDTAIANSYRYENIGTQEGYGVEAEIDWRLARSLSLAGNAAWQYNETQDSGTEAPNAPGKQMYVRMIWTPANFWTVTPEIHYIGTRPRAPGDSRDPVTASTRLDLLLRYQNHYNDWDVALRMRNLLDEDLREPSIGNDSIAGGAALANDVPLEGLRIMAEFRYFLDK